MSVQHKMRGERLFKRVVDDDGNASPWQVCSFEEHAAFDASHEATQPKPSPKPKAEGKPKPKGKGRGK